MDPASLRRALLDWYDAHARTLPWRAPPGSGAAVDPYRVWLSEVLLQQTTTVHAAPDFEAIRDALEAAGLKAEVAEVTMRPENTIELTGEDAQRMQKLLDVIEDLDDVQDVFHNASIED